MDCVWELIKNCHMGGLEINNSEGLFSTEEKAIATKEYLEIYNPDVRYVILYRRVN